MNKAGGFITLHRQITEWEWYKDTCTKVLFLHLLLTANFIDTRFMGKTIKRGQVVTSLPSLSEETNLSVRQIRTALSHLISTGEVTNKSFTKYRVISIVNYDKYQDVRQTDRQTSDRQTTDKRQTNDRQVTDKRQHHNNNNNDNKENNDNNVNKRVGTFVPPTLEDVKNFCQEKGIQVDAEMFVLYYESNGWMVGRNKMKSWKAAVQKWAREDGNRLTVNNSSAQSYQQRDYSGEQDKAFNRMMAKIRSQGNSQNTGGDD